VATVNALGRRTSTIYRATGDVAATVDALGYRTSNLYDAASRQIASVNALGQRSSTTLDAAGQSIARIDPLGRRTSTAYDTAGRAIQNLDANGNRTSTLYDAAGRALAGVNGLGYRTSNTFDAAGRRVVLTDARGYRTSFLFDAKSQDLGSIDPLGRRVSFGYDGVGNKAFKLDPRGNRVSFSYDANQRLILEKYSTGMRVSSSYDAVGNRTVLADAIGRTSSAFDAKNRQVQSVNPDGKRISYTLDALDRRSRLIDPNGGRFSYGYDARDQLTAMTNPQGKRTSFTLDALGRQTAQRHGNGARTSQTFDAAGQLTVLANTQGNGATVNRFSYTFDQVGNRVGVKESSGDRTSWTFDRSYQLLREFRSGATAFNVTYVYDPAGNRTAQTDSGTRTSYTLDAANQLTLENTSGARTSYTNDSCGNRTLKNAPGGMTFYAWDEKNRLKQVDPVGGPVTMLYNGDNKRVQKKTSGQTRKFLYDVDKVLEEYDATGAVSKEYTSTTEQYGELLSAYSGGNTSYYEPDALGSTDALLNDAGTVSDRYAYRAFGLSLLPPGPTANDFQFVGRQGYFKDPEISFYFLNNRYLDFATGRFVSEDPSGYKGGDANLYRYVGNNPVNGIDPSGLSILVNPGDTYERDVRVTFERGSVEWMNVQRSRDWEALARGYYYVVSRVSPASDLLRDKIFNELGPWENNYWRRASERDLFSTQRIELHGNPYNKIELFRFLPPTFWKHVRDSSSRFSDLIYESLDEDDLITVDPGRALEWTIITAPNPSILGQLWAVLQEVTSSVVRNVSRLTLQGVSTLLKVGFVSFLQAAGIDAADFEAAIERFSGFANLLWKIAQDPRKFVKNLVEGGRLGFARFAQNFPGNVKAIAIDWLFRKLESFQQRWSEVRCYLPTDFTLESMGLFLLKAAGLTYTKVRSTLTRLGYENLGRVIDYLKTQLGDPAPTFDKIRDRIREFNRTAPAADQFNLEEIKIQLLNSLPGLIGRWAVDAFAKFAAMAAFPGGAALAGIWKTVKWAVDNIRALGDFFGTIGEALQKAYNDPAGLANTVVQGLTTATKLVLDLVARLLGVDTFVASISALVARVLNWLPDKITKLIVWLLGSRRSGGCGFRRASAGNSCFAWDTLTLTAQGLRPIGEIEVGCLLPLLKPWQKTSAETGQLLERDESRLRVVRCRLDKEPGQWVDITLLRGVQWLEAREVRVGGQLLFDLPEMGAVGEAAVLAVEACPQLPKGDGRLVISTFRHSRGELYDLMIEGESKPIAATPTHPFWSADRQAWVSAGELDVGERLLAENGSTPRIRSLPKKVTPEPVCNLEVEGDHCYLVGKQGLLVHNASIIPAANTGGGTGGDAGTTGSRGGWTPCDSLGQRRRRYYFRQVRIPERHGSSRWVFMNVVERAVSWIRSTDFANGTIADDDARKWVQNVVGVDEAVVGHIDQAGHVIARELGGAGELGATPLNVFPQNAVVNTDQGRFWRRRELEILGLFRNGCPTVCIRIVLRYPRANDPTVMYPARPNNLIYDLWVNGMQRPTAQGPNPE
jgi:RHS repeat-associated protein